MPSVFRWLPRVVVLYLALPGVLGSQTTRSESQTRPEVVDLDFHGVRSVEEEELRKNIATDESHCISFVLRPICWISKSRFFYQREYLDRTELARDVLRAQVFYWKRGFRATEVDTTVTDRGDDKVAVAFNIAEGPPTLVNRLEVVQTDTILNERDISRRLVLKAGEPLNLIRLDTTVINLRQALWDRGYADAIVDTSIVVHEAEPRADVTINMNPRWRATISEIIIEGHEEITEATIRRSLTVRSGDIFRYADLLRSQRALYESNLFRRATVDVPRQEDSAKLIVVNVQEAPHREVRVSTGFNTIEFFQVETRFAHFNFTGGGRRLELQGAVGNLFANALTGRLIFRDVASSVGADSGVYMRPTYSVSVNLRQPWFLAQANELALSLFSHRRSAPGIYVDRGYGSSFTFTRMLTERAPASAVYRFEITNIQAGDVYFCVNHGVCDRPTLDALRLHQRLSPAQLTASIERTDNVLSPRSGIRGNAEAEHASGLTMSDFRYNRALGDGAAFLPIGNRSVLGGHLRMGWVSALAGTVGSLGRSPEGQILHPRKRFFAGGARSVRGYGENQLGPRVLTIPPGVLRRDSVGCAESVAITLCNPNAEPLRNRDFEPRPLGGNVLIEASAEYRFPVYGRKLFGAVFIDGGWVSQRINAALPRSRAAVTPGFGGRYLSAVGPIRVDIGFNPQVAENLPVITEAEIDGERRLVTLQTRRRYSGVRTGLGGIFDRMTLHLSIGEAF